MSSDGHIVLVGFHNFFGKSGRKKIEMCSNIETPYYTFPFQSSILHDTVTRNTTQKHLQITNDYIITLHYG